MTRWMRGPELDHPRDRAPFDPVAEGARYRLSPELSLAIWERTCADATDAAERRDRAQAQQRFHDIAARIAARGGRLRPDVGKLTRAGLESDRALYQAAHAHELAIPTPGRQTLVDAEAHRWPAARDTPAVTAADGEPVHDARELLGAAELVRLIAALRSTQRSAPSSETPAGRSANPQLGSGPADESSPARDRSTRDNALPPPILDRMERAFGRRFDDVEIHADSAEVPAGRQAFTRGKHIHLERGIVELGEHRERRQLGHHGEAPAHRQLGHHDEPAGRGAHGDHRDHVLAHEFAHVVQQSRAPGSGADRPPTRAALEADAHQAALSVLAGHSATVQLFAPPASTLGFSSGEPRPPGSQPGTAAPAAPARTSSPAAASPAPPSRSSGGTPAPRSTLRTTAFDRPAAAHQPAVPAAPAIPVAGATHRGSGGDGLLLPEAPGALSPAAAGRLQNIRAANQGVAGAVTNLPTADHQTGVARNAVVEPQAEQDAHAQHDVVAAVDDRPPPSPEIEKACAHIREVIKAKRPPSKDKLVDAKPREMAQEAGDQMSGDVDQRAGTVRQGYADMQQNPQGTPSRTPVPATLPPGHVATPPVDAGAGAPDPLPASDVSLDGDVAAQNKNIDDAGMNTEPGKLVKDGPIGDARGGAYDLQNLARTDPQKVLADQAAAVAHARSDMHALQAAAEKALADARSGTVGHIATHTTGVKGGEEQQRAQAGALLQDIFTRTQNSVDALLQPLAGNAVARWNAGVGQLSTAFETALADTKQQIDQRHHGHHGAFGWLENGAAQAEDWFGLPDWVTQEYDRAEAAFADGATGLITDISRDVNQVIDDCKKLIEQARKDIDTIVHSLPASLQTWAQGEAAKLGQKLDQLSQHVDQTQHGLDQDLINRANGAVQQVREQIADLREKARGALGKIANAIAGFMKDPAKAIVNGLLSALGIPPDQFWSVVGQLGDVVGAISRDPVKFGKALISGAGQGFKQFFEHFPQHLKEILLNWLFDTLGATGVPIPPDFSGPSIMSTVLAIVGIDTPLVTAMLGGELSGPDEAAEAHQELAGVLSGDPKALVALLREEFDPASLLPMIKDAAISFLIQTLITQAAERIAALLVPGGAILQAVEAIFKVLQWVINNAARIFTLIQALVGAAAQAVAGNIAGVASAVESSLVQIIVVVIDFLTGYLGLGGLGGKLKGVIMKVGGKLKALLKKVLGAVAKRAKARARTKHGHHKKPGNDKTKSEDDKAAHPEQDDRDPQKVEEDARAPRNHMRDPDDKDPRNHHKDDEDPRSHEHDDDERGPRRRKPEDDAPHKHHDKDDDRDPRKPHREDDPEKRKEKEEEEEDEDDITAPRSMSESRVATLTDPPFDLLVVLADTRSGEVLHQQSVSDPVQVTRRLLATHRDARFVKSTRHLVLPAVSGRQIQLARSASAIGQEIVTETGVAKVTVSHDADVVVLRGQINPSANLFSAQVPRWLKQVVMQLGKQRTQEVLQEVGKDALSRIAQAELIELISHRSSSALGSVVWLSQTRLSKQALLILKKKTLARKLDLDWLASSTSLENEDFEFLAVDTSTKWDVFKRVATRPPLVAPSLTLSPALAPILRTSLYLDLIKATHDLLIQMYALEKKQRENDDKDLAIHLRGLAGELATFSRMGDVAPEHDITERQVVMGTGPRKSILDFKVSRAVDASALGIEVKAQTGETWRRYIDNAMGHAGSLVAHFAASANSGNRPPTSAPEPIVRMLTQLQNAIDDTNAAPILVISDDISDEDLADLRKLLFFVLNHRVYIFPIEETHINDIRKNLRAGLGLSSE